MQSLLRLAVLCLICCCATACGEPPVTPKPRGFPRVDFPTAGAAQSFRSPDCPFRFEHPSYTRIEKDSAFFDEAPIHPCWLDVYYPDFNARLHLTYYPVGAGKDFEQLKADAFELADFHNKKANYIEEQVIRRPGLGGMVFEIDGPAASPYQFFLTDTTTHFVRGSFYFMTQARPDSLAPVVDFVQKDLEGMLGSFVFE